MARCAVLRHRWLIAALCGCAAAIAAEPPPAAPAAAPATRAVGKQPGNAKMPEKSTHAPPAELLDWLGRYADAGDGLDPLGLDELDPAPAKGAVDKERQQ
jgi:hypothetical protein